jgi:hypothetical protein
MPKVSVMAANPLLIYSCISTKTGDKLYRKYHVKTRARLQATLPLPCSLERVPRLTMIKPESNEVFGASLDEVIKVSAVGTRLPRVDVTATPHHLRRPFWNL